MAWFGSGKNATLVVFVWYGLSVSLEFRFWRLKVYSVEGAVTTLSAVRGYSSDLHKICSRQRMHEHSLRFAVAALGGQVSSLDFGH